MSSYLQVNITLSLCTSRQKVSLNVLRIPGSLDRGASLVLASVVHFKSPWDNPFDFYYTEKAPFYFTNGKSTPVDMMALQDDFPYGHLKQLDAHFVSIPYKVAQFVH